MKKYLEKLPKEIQDLLCLAGDTASLRRMPVFLVGGFVRDLILGVKNLDLDIVVEGDGVIFAEDLAARLNARLIRHRRFGTATVIAGHHLKIDVVTARKETYPAPAALPVVEFGTLKDDLRRRDFTINAMAISINKADFGSFLDSYNGKSDLKNKQIRILHELSFIDDPTRMLRAIRFEKRYDFKIEKNTLKCLRTAVKNKMLERVEPQRLRDELILILKEAFPIKQLKRIQELAGFAFVNKRLALLKKTSLLFNSVEKEIKWFHEALSPRRKLDTWLIYFIALIDSLGDEYVRSVCKRFVFRKGEEKRILNFTRNKLKFISKLSRKNLKPSDIFKMLEPLSYEVILLVKAKHKNPILKKHIEDFLEIYNGMRIYISGHDLQGLGVAPGPHYQKIFSKVLKSKLNGLVKTKQEELSLIQKLLKNNKEGFVK